MKQSLLKLPPFDAATGDLNVIIETPKGSRNKYAYDEDAGLVRFKKLLPQGMVYPFDFGFIPSTQAGDGDPLDVLLLSAEALFPGCFVKARLLGALKAEQREGGKTNRNDRLIAVPVLEYGTSPTRSLSELDARLLAEIEGFFVFSHQLEGKPFRILGRAGARAAHALVKRASRAFRRNRGIEYRR